MDGGPPDRKSREAEVCCRFGSPVTELRQRAELDIRQSNMPNAIRVKFVSKSDKLVRLLPHQLYCEEPTVNDESAMNNANGEIPFRVLVVDDDRAVRQLIFSHLRAKGYEVELAAGGREAIEQFNSGEFDLVLLDLLMPEVDGLETLSAIRERDHALPVFLMTAYATVDRAVQAMKSGATEFLMKPLSLDVLAMLAEKVRTACSTPATIEAARSTLTSGSNGRALITRNHQMSNILALIAKITSLPSTVLIQGESGTGKELVARAIHDSGIYRQHRFVALNCAVLSAELLASELFGYEKGAFTGASSRKIGFFEAAQGGTIFLDEISEMDVELQAKLLRVIQEHKFRRIGGTLEIASDARIIASTNKDLAKEVKRGTFRKDLFYRINVVKIAVPPLRERPEDIPLLAHHFLLKYTVEFDKEVTRFEPRVMDRLLLHQWDGNVRELQNVVEHAVAVAEGASITLADLPAGIGAPTTPRRRPVKPKPFRRAKQDFERDYLTFLLELTNGNIAEVSRISEIPRQHIYSRLERYKIDVADYRILPPLR